jgi:hypothetical protein
VAIATHCECGGRFKKRQIHCPDGQSNCIVFHYQLICEDCEAIEKQQADAKVARLILRKFREENPDLHLSTCEQTRVVHPSGEDGSCGEGTCESVRLEGVVKCPHGQRRQFEWRGWSTMAELFEEMDEA